MTIIAQQPLRHVNVAVRSNAGIAIGSDDKPQALVGEVGAEQALSLSDDAPRAIALKVPNRTGMAFAGDRRFTAIGAVAGARGKAGPEGGSAIQRVAGEVLSALFVVYEQGGEVFRLDYRDGEHIDQVLGITLTAAPLGQAVNVQRSGAVDDAGWNWALGRVWLGANGSLTQTPAVDGYDVLIGSAVSPTRITLNLQDPIELE